MVTDVLNFVENLDKREMETQLALQCSPLIMGLKISNLFIISALQQKRVLELFKNTDFDVLYLAESQGKVMFLVYQKEQLWQYLSSPQIRAFLQEYGYIYDGIEEALKVFVQRYADYLCNRKVFPHEMGIMLGYPIEDVKSFIRNNGKNYLHAGYWKVYHNLEAALELFESYDRAIAYIMSLVTKGISITNILNICTNRKNLGGISISIPKYTAV